MKLNMTYNAKRNSWSARQDNCLFVLSKKFNEQKFEGDQEYMIIRQLGNHACGFIVEPVTDDYVLVEHKGFVCHGGMCNTDASVIYPERFGSITPGRCQDILFEVSNVNLKYGEKPRKGIPGYIYVHKDEYRGAGIPSIEFVDLKKVADTSEWRKTYMDKYKVDSKIHS